MSRALQEQLMQLHDDELAPEQLAALEKRVAEDPEAAGVLRGLEQVGQALRGVAEEQGTGAEQIADLVMARIDAEDGERSAEPGSDAGARVLPLSRRWRHTVPTVAGVLALAAAAVLVARSGALARHPAVEGPPHTSAHLVAQARSAAPKAPVAEPAPAPAEADGAPSVAIETVDFGSHDGTIFMVSAGDDATPVVWLTDEPAETGSGMEPL